MPPDGRLCQLPLLPLRGEIDSKPREQFANEFPEVAVDDNQDAE